MHVENGKVVLLQSRACSTCDGNGNRRLLRYCYADTTSEVLQVTCYVCGAKPGKWHRPIGYVVDPCPDCCGTGKTPFSREATTVTPKIWKSLSFAVVRHNSLAHIPSSFVCWQVEDEGRHRARDDRDIIKEVTSSSSIWLPKLEMITSPDMRLCQEIQIHSYPDGYDVVAYHGEAMLIADSLLGKGRADA